MNFQTFPGEIDLSFPKRIKFGIDPTFPRLHLGHLVPLRLVKNLINQGHNVTIVLGTFTAQLGDPSGRDSTRPILSKEIVEKNADIIAKQIIKFLGCNWNSKFFENGSIHNEMKLPEFFGIVSNFSLNNITSRNAFADRIKNNHPIALHELLVPICQGWDSVHLETEIEIGGQDQLFNFQVARKLQEIKGQKPQDCILMPIICGTDGRKMSKSLGNCIFLDENPRDMFGQIMSIPDDVMKEWILFLSEGIKFNHENPMHTKKELAFSIVTELHDINSAADAQDFFEKTVQKKEIPDNIPEIIASNILETVVLMDNISKTAARKLISAGAITVNGEKVFDENQTVHSGQVIRRGKRTFIRIK